MDIKGSDESVILTCQCMDHKEVKVTLNSLAKVSHYFERMRNCGLKEMQEKCVYLAMFSAADVESIVDFSVNGVLEIKDFQTDIDKLLHLADYFGMDDLQKFCKSAMEEQLRKIYGADASVLNWAFSVSLLYRLGMENFLVKHCAKNINNIHRHTFFSTIADDLLYRVLQSPKLHVKTEIETFDILMKWCGDNFKKLRQTSELYQLVHIPSVTSKELEQLLNLMKKYGFFEFGVYIEEKYKFYMENSALFLQTFPEYNFVRNGQRCIVVIGGLQNGRKALPFIEEEFLLQTIKSSKFHAKLNFDYGCRWLLPFNICEFAVCILNHFIYIVGGQRRYVSSGKMARSTLFVFNPHLGKWTKLASMREKRCLFYIGVVGEGLLMAVGGCNQTGVLSSTECYSLQTQAWTDGPALPCPLHEHAGCIYDGNLYVSGGHDGSNLTNRMLHLSNIRDEWKECQPMRNQRSYHVMTVVGDNIMVMGGAVRTEAGELCDCYDCELYNPATDQWTATEIPTMPQDCFVSCCLPIHMESCYILCFGGYSFTRRMYDNSGVLYDSEEKTWTNLHLNNIKPALMKTMCVFAHVEMRTID